jgi:RHS repeat-associated protein
LVQWQGAQRLIPITDQAGAVQEVLNESGKVLWHCSLEAYGELANQSGAPPSSFRLRGQYFDRETGFHYNFHRTYDPQLGDYLSPDPIGIQGGANFYSYPRNPLLWDDPFGLKCGRSSCKAEAKMDKHFQGKGYSKISIKGKGVMANGIDAIYHNPNGKPPYIIAEAKSGCAVLRWSGPKDPTTGKGTIQQMSDAWINGKPGNSSQSRLEAALPPPQPGEVDHLAAIQSAPAGDVGKTVYNPDKTPTETKTGTYNNGNPTSKTF